MPDPVSEADSTLPDDVSDAIELVEAPEVDAGEVSEGPIALAETVSRPLANPVDVYMASLASDNSRKAARDCLKRVLRVIDKPEDRWHDMPWWTLRPEHTYVIRARLLAAYPPSTVKLTLSMLRGVLHKAFVLGRMPGDAFERATSWDRVRGGTDKLAGRMLSDEEIASLRAACEAGGPFWGAMDGAILALGLGGAVRREEIARMRVEDVADDCRTVTIRGKGNKTSTGAPLPAWAAGALESWLAQRDRFPFESKQLFVVQKRNGKADTSRHLSKWQVWERLKEVGKRAGVDFAPHDLRRTFASTLLDAGVDIVVVQKLMRHSDPRTTSRYDRRPVQVRAAAVKNLEKWGA